MERCKKQTGKFTKLRNVRLIDCNNFHCYNGKKKKETVIKQTIIAIVRYVCVSVCICICVSVQYIHVCMYAYVCSIHVDVYVYLNVHCYSSTLLFIQLILYHED